MATAANDALQQTPMSSAAQNALDLLVNTMNPTDGVYFGNSKSQCYEYSTLRGSADGRLLCRGLWCRRYHSPDDTGLVE